jgi:hypothetical protein
MKSIEFIDLNLPLTLDKPWTTWHSPPNQIPSSHGSLQLPESRQAAQGKQTGSSYYFAMPTSSFRLIPVETIGAMENQR